MKGFCKVSWPSADYDDPLSAQGCNWMMVWCTMKSNPLHHQKSLALHPLINNIILQTKRQYAISIVDPHKIGMICLFASPQTGNWPACHSFCLLHLNQFNCFTSPLAHLDNIRPHCAIVTSSTINHHIMGNIVFFMSTPALITHSTHQSEIYVPY